MGITATLRATKRVPILQVAKASIATIAAWLVAGWLIPGPLPVFAAIAALLVVQPSVNQSLGKAIERSIGVILGVVIATGISLAFGQSTWIILVAVVVAMLVAWALKMTPGTSNQVAISAMLVLALGASSPEYALDRVLETLIGAAIGIIVNALDRAAGRGGPRARARSPGSAPSSRHPLDRLAEALEGPQIAGRASRRCMIEARLLRPMRDAADAAIDAGEESLTLNPRRSAHREELARAARRCSTCSARSSRS